MLRELQKGETRFEELINPGWEATLSEEQKHAFSFYKSDGYKQINHALWTGEELSLRDKRIVALLQTALNAATLQQDLIVWRGSRHHPEVIPTFKRGHKRVHRGFMSTSLSMKIAQRFYTGNEDLVPVLMKILVKAGECGGYVHRIPEIQHPEFEVLLPFGTKYTILYAVEVVPELIEKYLQVENLVGE
ncbi:ADP-ribosyltransferase [Kordiimonas aquimaris]|uniref:ADP-ribosyltransferase n=1 Tax=Kordiimonas aquimaris TaxID=707591 RepID=UPI0021D3D958|nr:ADP-ribosyltransferase [Kordiimonas aquimaris]